MANAGLEPALAAHFPGLTFRTLVDVRYNSALTTGNVMNTGRHRIHRLRQHDHEAFTQTRCVALVIGCYATGAVVGALSVREFVRHGLVCAAVILGGALLLLARDERDHLQSQPE